MRDMVNSAGLNDRIVCDSAGTIGYHRGARPDSRMRATAKQRGQSIDGSARQITAEDFNHFDLILVMDHDNRKAVEKLARKSPGPATVRMLCDFASHHNDKEVPDPYYGGDEGFHHVLDLVTDACTGLLASLTTES